MYGFQIETVEPDEVVDTWYSVDVIPRVGEKIVTNNRRRFEVIDVIHRSQDGLSWREEKTYSVHVIVKEIKE